MLGPGETASLKACAERNGRREHEASSDESATAQSPERIVIARRHRRARSPGWVIELSRHVARGTEVGAQVMKRRT